MTSTTAKQSQQNRPSKVVIYDPLCNRTTIDMRKKNSRLLAPCVSAHPLPATPFSEINSASHQPPSKPGPIAVNRISKKRGAVMYKKCEREKGKKKQARGHARDEKYSQLEPQMFPNLNPLSGVPDQLANLNENFGKLGISLESLMDKFSSTMNNLGSKMSKPVVKVDLGNAAKEIMKDFGENGVPLRHGVDLDIDWTKLATYTSVVIAVIALAEHRNKQVFATVGAICLGLKLLIPKLYPHLEPFLDWVKQTPSVEPEGIDTYINRDTISAGLLMYMYKALFQTAHDKEGSTVTNFLLSRGTSIRVLKDNLELTTGYFLKLIEEFINWCLNKIGRKEITLVPDPWSELERILNRLKEISDDLDTKKCTMDSVLAYEIRNLEADYIKYIRSLDKGNMGRSATNMSSHIQMMFNSLNRRIREANLVGTEPRIPPVAIVLTGPAGVGKSNAMYSLLHEVTAFLQGDKWETFKKNKNDFRYDRNAADKFWEGYRDQFNCVFDEFGAVKDAPGTIADNPYLAFISAVNSTAYRLSMAVAENKGSQTFKSKLIWATTNRQKFDIASIEEQEALTRRFSMPYLCTVHPSYAINPAEQNPWNRRFDRKNADGTFKFFPEREHLVFYKYDFLQHDNSRRNHHSGIPGVIDGPFTYRQVFWQIIREYNANEIGGNKFVEDMDSAILRGHVLWDSGKIPSDAEIYTPIDVNRPVIQQQGPTDPYDFGRAMLSAYDRGVSLRRDLAEQGLPVDLSIRWSDPPSSSSSDTTPDTVNLPSAETPWDGDNRDSESDDGQTFHSAPDIANDTDLPGDMSSELELLMDEASIFGKEDILISKDICTDVQFAKFKWMQSDSLGKVFSFIEKYRDARAKYGDDCALYRMTEVGELREFIEDICMKIKTGYYGRVRNDFNNPFYESHEKMLKRFSVIPKVSAFFPRIMERAIVEAFEVNDMIGVTWWGPKVPSVFLTVLDIEGMIRAAHFRWAMDQKPYFNPTMKHRLMVHLSEAAYGAAKVVELVNRHTGIAGVVSCVFASAYALYKLFKTSLGMTKKAVTSTCSQVAKLWRHPKERKAMVPANKVAQSADGQGLLNANKVMRRNMWYYALPGSDKVKGVICLLSPSIAFSLKHYGDGIIAAKESNKSNGVMKCWRLISNVNKTPPIEIPLAEIDVLIEETSGSQREMVDKCIVKFLGNRPLQSPKAISHLFIPDKAVWYDRAEVALMKHTIEGTTFPYHMCTARVVEDITYPDQNPKWKIDRGFEYPAVTQKGDCMSLLIRMNPGLNDGKIAGFHVAGDSTSVGFAIQVTREDIEYWITLGDTKPLAADEADDLKTPTGPQGFTAEDGLFNVLGVADPPATNAGNSYIVRSKLYKKLPSFPPLMRPAKLHPFMKDGELIDPLSVRRREYGRLVGVLDNRILEAVNGIVISDIFKKSTKAHLWNPRVLSFDEAVLGIEGEIFMKPISRATSPGYPFSEMKLPGRGKTYWFGNGESYDLNNANCKKLRAEVGDIIAKLKKGVRPLFIYKDFPKDERLLKEKVVAGKTRFISSSPLHYTIVMRMYFLDMIAWLKKNNVANGVAVGINVYSDDWGRIVRHFRQVCGAGVISDSAFIAGDFSKYDSSLPPAIMRFLLALAKVYYGNEEDHNVRNILFEDIVNSRHVFSNIIYEWMSGNPSGNFCTAEMNSLAGRIVMMYAVVTILLERNGGPFGIISSAPEYDIYKATKEAMGAISGIYYGDDNVIAVAPAYRDIITQSNLTRVLAKMRMTYTPEDKGASGMTHELRRLDEITFLKRKFLYEDSRWYAPLALETITEMVQWTKRKDEETKDETSRATCYKSLVELSLHPKHIFERYSEEMLSAFKANLEFIPDTSNQAILRAKSLDIEPDYL